MLNKFYVAPVVGIIAVIGFACGGSGAQGDFDADDGEVMSEVNTPRSGAALASDEPSDRVTGVSHGVGSGEDPAEFAVAPGRKIIFTATLALTSEDVSGTFVAVEQVTRAAAGYVERSSIGSKHGSDGVEHTSATITIRVPAERYNDAVNELRTLHGVDVVREESSSTEVTEEYTDLESRLSNLERSEAQYLVLLEDAKNIQEVLLVNERIDGVRLQIEQIQGRLRLLDDLTGLATITVSISSSDEAPVPFKDGGPKSFAKAFGDAWDSSLDGARHVIAASAVASVFTIWVGAPLLVLGGLSLAAGRRTRGTAADTD